MEKILKLKYFVIFFILILIILIHLNFIFPVKIGVIIPLDSNIGTEQNLMIRYLKSKIKFINFRPIKFIIENPVTNKEQIKESVKKLKNEGVKVIIGGSLSSDGILIADEINKEQIITFGITCSTHILSNKKDFYYRIVNDTRVQGKLTAIYFNKNDNIKNLLIIKTIENPAYVETFNKYFIDTYSKLKKINTITYEYFDTIENLSIKIKEYNPDSIFLILSPKLMIKFIKDIKQKFQNITFYSSSWSYGLIFSDISGNLFNDMYILTENDTSSDIYKKIIDDFEKLYNIKTSFASHSLISVLDIIISAIKKVGYNKTKLKKYFDTPRLYNYAYGKVLLNEYGDGKRDFFYIFKINNEKIYLEEKLNIYGYKDIFIENDKLY